jgi:hypothetical protein
LTKNYYAELGLSPHVSTSEAKAQLESRRDELTSRLARTYAPSSVRDLKSELELVGSALVVLTDPRARSFYDQELTGMPLVGLARPGSPDPTILGELPVLLLELSSRHRIPKEQLRRVQALVVGYLLDEDLVERTGRVSASWNAQAYQALKHGFERFPERPRLSRLEAKRLEALYFEALETVLEPLSDAEMSALDALLPEVVAAGRTLPSKHHRIASTKTLLVVPALLAFLALVLGLSSLVTAHSSAPQAYRPGIGECFVLDQSRTPVLASCQDPGALRVYARNVQWGLFAGSDQSLDRAAGNYCRTVAGSALRDSVELVHAVVSSSVRRDVFCAAVPDLEMPSSRT